MDCENCRHLTVVGLHDTGPRSHMHTKVSGNRGLETFKQIQRDQRKLRNSMFVLTNTQFRSDTTNTYTASTGFERADSSFVA